MIKMISAIKELKNKGFNLEGLVKDYQKSEQTFINNDVLFYKNISEGLMALAHFKNGVCLNFVNNFNNFSVMLDVSRGAVFKVEYIKKLLRSYAMMGLNEVWLYLEDLYELDNYLDFGYLRGCYTDDELKEVVKYAEIFGIKIIPTIQTLGHMEQFLKWNNQIELKDQTNVLLMKSEQTYQLIDEMLKKLQAIFKSNKIHLGLDETWGFGFGNFYKKNGYISQLELFFDHLEVVNGLALKNGFKEVLIWSDMPYRILSKNNSYYDEKIVLDQKIVEKIFSNIKLVYWDYYNRDFEKVEKMIKNHLNITSKFCFASGTWIWTRFTYDKNQTDNTCKTHLKAAIASGVKDFTLTQWMDDGAYGDHETTLLGVYEMSLEALTRGASPDDKTYHFITNHHLEVAYNKTKLNNLSLSQVGLLWDDPQYAIYLDNYARGDLTIYENLVAEMEKLIALYEGDERYDFENQILKANYYKVLGRKTFIKQYLKKEVIEISEFFNNEVKHLRKLINLYRDKWYKNYKMNGFEKIQLRLAGQIVRAEEMIVLAKMYNEKKITEIAGILIKKQPKSQYIHPKYSHIAFTTRPFDS